MSDRDRLADEVRRIVDERLRELGVERVYSSTSLPPGIASREHFASECRRLRVGEKQGRVWTVAAATWRTARAEARKPHRAPAAPTTDDERADALLESAKGVRLVRGGR